MICWAAWFAEFQSLVPELNKVWYFYIYKINYIHNICRVNVASTHYSTFSAPAIQWIYSIHVPSLKNTPIKLFRGCYIESNHSLSSGGWTLDKYIPHKAFVVAALSFHAFMSMYLCILHQRYCLGKSACTGRLTVPGWLKCVVHQIDDFPARVDICHGMHP